MPKLRVQITTPSLDQSELPKFTGNSQWHVGTGAECSSFSRGAFASCLIWIVVFNDTLSARREVGGTRPLPGFHQSELSRMM